MPDDRTCPTIFSAAGADGAARLAELKSLCRVVDDMAQCIDDLFRIDFPYLSPAAPEYSTTRDRYVDHYPSEVQDSMGVWAHFPWRKCLVHLPDEATFVKLRTARNQFLIEPAEQEAFYGATLALAGLSVGSSVLQTIVMSGGPRRIRIADPDVLSVVNLNRLNAAVCDLGESKAVLAARRVTELNPFQDLDVWPDGLSEEALDAFLSWGGDSVDLFIEEVDDLYLKIQARYVARAKRIPVIMATDNGDNAIIDVERFDLEPDRPLFHGAIADSVLASVPKLPTQADRIRVAATIVGLDITPRTQYSMQLVGSKIPTWPQLGNAATVSGAIGSYVARRILTGQAMPSGRYHVRLDETLEPGFQDRSSIADRTRLTEEFNAGLTALFGVNLL